MRDLDATEYGTISGGYRNIHTTALTASIGLSLLASVFGNNGGARGLAAGMIGAFGFGFSYYKITGTLLPGHTTPEHIVASLVFVPTIAGLFYMDDSC